MNRFRQLVILLPALLGSLPAWADSSVVISVEDVWHLEGSTGNYTDLTFNVTLTGAPAGYVTVAYSISPCTATPGDDYRDVSGILTFPPAGPGPTSEEVKVPVFGDLEFEGTESLVLHLFDATGAVLARDRALGFIRNDDDLFLPPAPPRSDYNRDGRSDIEVWYERLSGKGQPPGQGGIWPTNGQTATPMPPESPAPPVAEGWRLAGSADVDADGFPDRIWYHPEEGLVFSTYTEAEGFSEPDFDSPTLLPANATATGEAVGTGDFSGDGRPDLLIRDSVSGALSVWVLDGHSIAGTDTPEPATGDPGWRPLATGDFDGDGSPDVLWIEDASRQLEVWMVNDLKLRETRSLGSPAAGWAHVATGDFDGDGDDDLLWQDVASELFMWFLEDTVRVCEDSLSPRTLALDGWDTWEVAGPR